MIDKLVKKEEAVNAVEVTESTLEAMRNDPNPIMLWGCGELAEWVVAFLKKSNVSLKGVFVDVNVLNKEFHGMKVNSLDELCVNYPSFSVIVGHLDGYANQAALENIRNVENIYSLYQRILNRHEIIDYDFIEENREAFLQTYNWLTDELSQKSYILWLNSLVTKSFHDLVPYVYEDMYFAEDIIKLSEGEVLVDGGAYTGDTIRDFVNRLSLASISNYKVYAFEPDKGNYAQLCAYAENLPSIKTINKGLWDKEATLHFNAKESVLSSISEHGDSIVLVDTIDNICAGEKVTFIKLDIEGAEMKALKGAEQTIKKHKPKLAICAYHLAADLITIPQYLKQLVPDYQLYFRLYQCGHSDAIIYAI
ncbi:MAG: FkbM family methyltransferase [Lachnospiraceae bacterium]|nr:FkbM family methyltransferase [Lachnospiraceae bacterium]